MTGTCAGCGKDYTKVSLRQEMLNDKAMILRLRCERDYWRRLCMKACRIIVKKTETHKFTDLIWSRCARLPFVISKLAEDGGEELKRNIELSRDNKQLHDQLIELQDRLQKALNLRIDTVKSLNGGKEGDFW